MPAMLAIAMYNTHSVSGIPCKQARPVAAHVFGELKITGYLPCPFVYQTVCFLQQHSTHFSRVKDVVDV